MTNYVDVVAHAD